MNRWFNKLPSLYQWTIRIALLSLIVGTTFFIVAISKRADGMIYAGFIYVVIAVAVNLLLMIAVIAHHFINQVESSKTLLCVYLQLLNLPIALFYFYIIVRVYENPAF